MKKIFVGLMLLLASAFAQAADSAILGQLPDLSFKYFATDSTGAMPIGTSPTAGTGTATGTGAGLPVSYSTKISTTNSTTANLASNGVFTGVSEEVVNFAEIRVSVFSSAASATDGLQMQQSSDGTNWDNIDIYSVPAATGKSFGSGVGARYFRLVYTNGATITTALRIQTTYHYPRTKPSAVRPQDGRSNDNDFEESLSYGMGFNGVTWDRSLSWNGAQLSKPYANTTNEWSYAALTGGITTTTPVAVKAAAGAGIRNYITALSCANAAAAVATEVTVSDGATVIWRGYLGLVAQASSMSSVQFPDPLKGTANTAVNVAAVTTAAQVYCNLQGFVGP